MLQLFKKLFGRRKRKCEHVYYHAGGIHTEAHGWIITVKCLNNGCKFHRKCNWKGYLELVGKNKHK